MVDILSNLGNLLKRTVNNVRWRALRDRRYRRTGRKNNSDTDAEKKCAEILPESFRMAVKYYSAGMAYLNTRPAQASIMFDRFADAIGVARFAADMGKMSSYYD